MGYPKQLLANNERVLLASKRHAIFMILQVLPFVFGVIILGLLALLSWEYVPAVGGWLGLLLLIGAIGLLAYAAFLFLEWNMEQYLITNYRIIQVEGIMNRGTFDSALEMVNDVQMNQSIFGRLFNFANVHIITGSDVGVNELHGIAKPFEFKRALLEAKLAFGDGNRGIPIEQTEFARFASNDNSPAPRGRATTEQPTNQFTTVESKPDPIRLVTALNELRNAGMISDAEFNEKMRQLTER